MIILAPLEWYLTEFSYKAKISIGVLENAFIFFKCRNVDISTISKETKAVVLVRFLYWNSTDVMGEA